MGLVAWGASRRQGSSLAAAAAVLAVACAGSPVDLGTDGVSLSSVTYRFAWDLDGVSTHDDGSWSIRDGAGHEVQVRAGRLSGYAVSLQPCAQEEESEASAMGALLDLVSPFGTSRARAGHGDEFDPSVALAVSEDLSALTDTRVTVDFAQATYCSAHWVVGPTDPEAAALDLDASLELSGVVIDEAGAAHDFEVSTALAYGVLGELEGAAGDRESAEVVIEREPGALLADVDLLADDESEVAWSALRNLVRPTRFELR
jgi:hypothetical protein